VPGRRTILASVVLAPWMAWALVRGLGLERGAFVTSAIAFTPVAAVSSWIPLVAALVLRRRMTALAALATLAAFAAFIVPGAVGGAQEPAAGARPVRVMTINLRFGHGDPRTVVDLVRRHRVEILSLVELTPEEVRRLDRAGLRRLLPNAILRPHPRPRGAGLYSTFPMRQIAATLPAGLVPQPAATIRLPGGAPIEVFVVHPPPPLTAPDAAKWKATLRAQPGAGAGAPLRLALGDFNATLDHHELRRLLGRGYKDAAATTGDGLAMTWPSDRRYPPVIAIDHVLADKRATVSATSTARVPGTDHRALFAELAYPSAAS
jgi:endonuclease/exonuclease/phosphatase (EEP) superfamily protein YafD